jgi:hypothetical protein
MAETVEHSITVEETTEPPYRLIMVPLTAWRRTEARLAAALDRQADQVRAAGNSASAVRG